MSKPKTRFVISAGGALREILSIRQNSNGDLQIIPKSHGHSGFTADERDAYGRPRVVKVSTENRIIEEHISFHRMLRSGKGIKVGRNVITQGGKTLRHSALVEGFVPTSLYPVLVRIYGKIQGGSYDHSPRKRDQIVHLGRIDGRSDTPIIALFVAGKLFDRSGLTWSDSLLSLVELDHFNLLAFSSRIEFPGLNFGCTAFTISAPAQLDGIDVSGPAMDSVHPMDNAAALAFLESSCRFLLKRVVEIAAVRNLPNLIFEVRDPSRVLPRLPMLNGQSVEITS